MNFTFAKSLKMTADLLQLYEVKDLLTSYERTYHTDNVDKRVFDDPEAQLLIAAGKAAIFEINNDGFPYVLTTTVIAEKGVIRYSMLDEVVLYVISVRKDGENVKFTTVPNGIYVGGDGKYSVTYCNYRCGNFGLTDEISVADGVEEFVFAYRTARNYCLMVGRNDEASVWDQRYNEEAAKVRCRRRARLPRRQWI